MPVDNPGHKPPQPPSPASAEETLPALPSDPWVTLIGSSAPADVQSLLERQVPGYQLLRELGRGGMGVVYEARQEGLNRIVALKMILKGEHASTDELARFQTEALAIARLQHPNIVQVHAVGSHNGLPFFVLEYCAGGTLAQRFAPGKGIDPRVAAGIVATLARAVHVAHQAGIIHRDLKPGNILFTKEGTPKVADFGLAKRLDDPSSHTQSGVIMGTPSYVSPEQARGKTNEIAPATDVFALGVILYEALTGVLPFVAATAWETLQLVCTHTPQHPRRLRPDVPNELDAIVLQCLEKNPRDRYASAAELADDLDRWQRGELVRARGHGALHRLGKRLRKHSGKAVAATAAGLCLLLLWVGLCDAGYRLPGSSGVQRWLDRREASVCRPVPSEETLRASAAEQRAVLRKRLVDVAASREGWFAPPNAGPDPWTQMQGTVALFSCAESDHEHYDKCVRRLDLVFEPNDQCALFTPGLGWPIHSDGNVSAEPCAWALLAIAKTLSVPGLAEGDDRVRLLGRLEQIQTILDNYRSLDRPAGQHNGGWTLFAQQDDPSLANPYVTLIVCQGLLELARADLGWHKSEESRDRLLEGGVAWLLGRFNGRGWTTPSTVSDQYNDGFSLQIFAALLDAEARGLVTLPQAVIEAIPLALADCSGRPADYQSPVVLFSASFRNHQGKPVAWAERRMRPVWHPWAVCCASRWQRRCERVGAPHDEIVRTRRILGHLLLTLGPAVIEGASKGETFVTAEILIGLTSVDQP